jgi:acylphosphatase
MVERRTVIFSGRVQGVGFRMTAVQFARGLAVSGTVKNLRDGTVEMVVEGSPEVLEGLIGRLREHFEAEVRMVEQVAGAGKMSAPGIRIIH